MKIPPPKSEAELAANAKAIAGLTLGELARKLGQSVPAHLKYAKGWTGQLIEKALGASAFNLDEPDFVNLGIELKTLPITAQNKPRESTYICKASIPPVDLAWEISRVWRKMRRMLWVPIESNKQKTLDKLFIGTPIFWSPSNAIENQLRQDWQELMEQMVLGHFDTLSAHLGKYLQLRPKAANAKTFIQVVNHDGQTISIVPKGFYLRTTLTQMIINEFYV